MFRSTSFSLSDEYVLGVISCVVKHFLALYNYHFDTIKYLKG